MPVLAAMRDREACRIAEAIWCAMHNLGDLRQRADGACTDAGHQQKLGEIAWSTFRSGPQRAVQAPCDDVLWPDIVMGGHDEVRQVLRAEMIEDVELPTSRCLGATIG